MSTNRYFGDVSSNNAHYDASAYRHKGGHLIVGIKATEGTGYVNPRYAQWVEDSHKQGVAVMHYHFAHPESKATGQQEFAHFWNTASHHFAEGDYVVFDEETNLGAWKHDAAHCHEFYVAAKGVHHDPVLYGSLSYLEQLGPEAVPPEDRIWVAAYGPEPKSLPKGMKIWAWQRTDGRSGPEPHSCAGIGVCDVSILNEATYTMLKGRAGARG